MSAAAADDSVSDIGDNETFSPPTSPGVDGSTSSLEASLKLLKESEMKLKSIVRRQFDEAVRANDVASVERFFKIFPLLKLHKEGLERYCTYLKAQLETSCRVTTRKILDVPENAPRYQVRFADAASMLLEEVAQAIDVHKPLVETYYGPGLLILFFPLLIYTRKISSGNLMDMIKSLQTVADDQFSTLLREFRTSRNLSQIQIQVEALNKQAAGKNKFATLDRPEAKTLDVILTEISLINVKVEQYVSFVKRRFESDFETDKQQISDANRYIMKTKLVVSTQEMLGQYVALEEYLMREMVGKAIGIDAIDEGAQVSTVVDDVFFVVKKSLQRAISSSSIDIICAMVNHASILLDDQYLTLLKNRLRSAASSASSSFDLSQFVRVGTSFPSSAALSSLANATTGTASGTQGDQGGAMGEIDTKVIGGWCVALNNIDVSLEYIHLLKKHVEEEVVKMFASLSEQSRGKLEMVLASLQAVGDRLKENRESGASEIMHGVVRPKIKPAIERLTAVDLNISEEQFAVYESEDPWCQALIFQMDRILKALQPLMTDTNHAAIVRATVNETATLLEKQVLKKRFSKLGGHQLEKDIRKLCTYLTSLTSWSIRDRFARLTQMATLLSLERETELAEYIQSDDSFAWRLTPTELRQVLALRVDFLPENIKKLKL